MPLVKTSFISKIILFLVAAMFSLSAMAIDFNENQRLANQGFATAQYDLGVMYNNGKGVRQDYAKAHNWYLKAASQGNATAQNNLGVMYSDGQGVRQDYAKAHDWYLKAASQGLYNAQFNLGMMYVKGEGVRQNKPTAKKWFGKACDNGFQRGCDNYRKLNEEGY